MSKIYQAGPAGLEKRCPDCEDFFLFNNNNFFNKGDGLDCYCKLCRQARVSESTKRTGWKPKKQLPTHDSVRF